MRGFFKEIRQDRIIFGGLMISSALTAISLIFIALNYGILPPYLPLYNQLPWGDERLVSTIFIFLPLLFVVIVMIINTILASVIYSKSQIISRMLGVATCLISFLSFLFVIRTILLIT